MQRRNLSGEAGFTLIELLIVIVVLGVLSAVVTFAVSGITDTGQTSACKADQQAVVTAEEAIRARSDVHGYLSMGDLVTLGMLHEASKWHDIAFADPGSPTTTLDGDTVTVHAAYSVVPIAGQPC
ncbi:MAG: type II secretion system protein [Acidimicrobiia bacterium]